MKQFLKFYHKDKEFVKMSNQTEKGFELIVLSDEILNRFLQFINDCEEKEDDICIVWQMKFKRENFILYKNCKFSTPMDNYNTSSFYQSERTRPCGKKFKVTCSGQLFYSDSYLYKNKIVKKTKSVYKDSMLLDRMLKIGNLNLISERD